MSEKRIDMKIVCPFYLGAYGPVLRCAPIIDAESTSSRFRSLNARNAYIDDFCASHCWQNCIIAQACIEKWESEQG